MKNLFLVFALFLTCPLFGSETSIQKITTTPVTLLWLGDAFLLSVGSKTTKIPLPPPFRGISNHNPQYPHIPGVDGLYFQHVIESTPTSGGISEKDVSYYAFRDIDGKEIKLLKNKEVTILRIELNLLINGKASQVTLWKQNANKTEQGAAANP